MSLSGKRTPSSGRNEEERKGAKEEGKGGGRGEKRLTFDMPDLNQGDARRFRHTLSSHLDRPGPLTTASGRPKTPPHPSIGKSGSSEVTTILSSLQIGRNLRIRSQ
jgi:hypothetical protein